MNTAIFKSGIATVFLMFTVAVDAASITAQWAVSDTSEVNCNGSPHGFWTNNLFGGKPACNDYFSFSNGSVLTEYDDGTAILDATAVNQIGYTADIFIEFGSFSVTQPSVKTGGGPELASWYFYQTIVDSSIIINDGVDTEYFVDIAGPYALQIGDGANDKTSAFGGSVWLNETGGKYTGGHWDLNMDFSPVPVPAAVWLFGSGLLGLVGIARSKPA